MSFSDKYANFYKRILPSPFAIAIVLTLFTFVLAILITKPEDVGLGSYSLKLAGDWEAGLWKEGAGGLYFAFQMMLMLVLGHILALSKPASFLIDKLTATCTNTANSAFIITFSTILVSLFNWGLGLIFGAILARKLGEKFARENKPFNYGLIGAAAYSGLMVWHGGISGSAPIKAADPGNLQSLVKDMPNVDLATIPDRIDMSTTIFSPMNIVVTLMLLIILPTVLYYIGKRSEKQFTLPKQFIETESKAEQIDTVGAEQIDQSKIFAIFFGSLIIFYALYKAVILPEELSLSFLTPNFINFSLLGLGIICHLNISSFTKAAGNAISGATGILIQFPLYFGILGIMVGSGLISEMSSWIETSSSNTSFPFLTFFSAGLVNVFVPSGGGQWVVQGPIIIAAAQELGVSYPKAIMALAYGDQLTNMIQPFWALPLLGITGLKAKEILPYTLILFLLGIVIFSLGLAIF
ncbi:MAG: TIGR00366 family protein [Crocinitomicaceae bacterium]